LVLMTRALTPMVPIHLCLNLEWHSKEQTCIGFGPTTGNSVEQFQETAATAICKIRHCRLKRGRSIRWVTIAIMHTPKTCYKSRGFSDEITSHTFHSFSVWVCEYLTINSYTKVSEKPYLMWFGKDHLDRQIRSKTWPNRLRKEGMSMEKISKEVTRSKAVQMQCGWW
jgi:hypothetical protein